METATAQPVPGHKINSPSFGRVQTITSNISEQASEGSKSESEGEFQGRTDQPEVIYDVPVGPVRKRSLVTFDPNLFENEGFSGSKNGTQNQLSEEDGNQERKVTHRLSRFHSIELHDPQSELLCSQSQLCQVGSKKQSSHEAFHSREDPRSESNRQCSLETLPKKQQSTRDTFIAMRILPPEVSNQPEYESLPFDEPEDQDQPLGANATSSGMLSIPGLESNADLGSQNIAQKVSKDPNSVESPPAQRTPTWNENEVAQEVSQDVSKPEPKAVGFLGRVNSLQENFQTEFAAHHQDPFNNLGFPPKRPTLSILKALDSPMHGNSGLEVPQSNRPRLSQGMFIISEQSGQQQGRKEGLFGSPVHMHKDGRPGLPDEETPLCSESAQDDHQNSGLRLKFSLETDIRKRLAKKSTHATCWTPNSDMQQNGFIPKLASCTSSGSQLFQIETPTADSILPKGEGKSLFQRLCSKESAFTDLPANKRPLNKQRLQQYTKHLDPNSPHHQSCCDAENPSVPVVTSKFSKFTKIQSKETVVPTSPQISPVLPASRLGSPELRDRRVLRSLQIKDQLGSLLSPTKVGIERTFSPVIEADGASPESIWQKVKNARTVIFLGLFGILLTVIELLKL